MHFGLLDMLLLTGSVQAILLAVYLFSHASIRGGRPFGSLFVLLSFHLVLVANDRIDFFIQFPHLLHISWILPALYGPFIMLFVVRVTRRHPVFKSIELLYFLPFFSLLLVMLPFFLQSAEAKLNLISQPGYFFDDFGWITQLVSWLHVVYFGISLWMYSKFQLQILDYSADEDARMLWLGQFLKLAMAVAVFGCIIFYAKILAIEPLASIYPYHILGIILIIYWSAYKLIKQPSLFQTTSQEAGFQEMAASSPIEVDKPQSAAPHQHLAEEMERLMQEEKLYRTQGLTLHDLAVRLKSNKQYVSETINQVFEKSFYDFVNEYRLREFAERVENGEDQNLTLLGIATNAGFNSKATFNAVFKKHYGVTPSEFQKMKLRPGKTSRHSEGVD